MNPFLQEDGDLINQLRDGNRSAFEQIFNKYWYALYRTAFARLGSHEESEEIVQDIFTALWNKRTNLLITALGPYLFGAVRKRVISHIRARIVHRKYAEYYTRYFTDETKEVVGYNELTEALEKAIDHLPEKSQKVFRLNRLQGLSVQEIAGILKMPRRTIEHHLTKSIRELRIHLKDYIMLTLLWLGF